LALPTPHEIWTEQFGAAEGIRARYGLKSAFEYVVGEKLMNFAEASFERPEFARELPRFVAAVRHLFESDQLAPLLDQLDEDLRSDLQFAEAEANADDLGDYALAAAKARLERFAAIRELLTAATLGTS
jgi:hypothetical protein